MWCYLSTWIETDVVKLRIGAAAIVVKLYHFCIHFLKIGQIVVIINICSIITKVLSILKELDVTQRAKIESKVLYRSDILNILFTFISNMYPVQAFNQEIFSKHDKILKMVRRDEEILHLFCFIVGKRLIVIDDFEFEGKKEN